MINDDNLISNKTNLYLVQAENRLETITFEMANTLDDVSEREIILCKMAVWADIRLCVWHDASLIISNILCNIADC